MNAKEFLEHVNWHIPEAMPKLTLERLRYWADLGVLTPRPDYTNADIQKAVALITLEQGARNNPDPTRREHKASQMPSGSVYQVLALVGDGTSEPQPAEIAVVRQALIQTELMTGVGLVYVNHSPISGATLESLLAQPGMKARFAEGAEHGEFNVFREVYQVREHETGRQLTTLAPVVFVEGVGHLVINSTFVFSGKTILATPGNPVTWARPLHEEFLDVQFQTLESIVDFMNAHQLIGTLVPLSEGGLELLKTNQLGMRSALAKSAQGALSVAGLSQLAPPHDDDYVESSNFGKMGHIDVVSSKDSQAPIVEMKITPALKRAGSQWIPYDRNSMAVKRYYSWLDYMWAELVDAITQRSQSPVCLRCGKLLEQRRGRRKSYCGPENPACYRPRQTGYVRKARNKAL